ncbi:AMP-binding protein [Streptomyces sp. NPDC001251]
MPEPRVHEASGESVLHGGELTDPGVTSLAQALARAARLRTEPAIRLIDGEGRESLLRYAELLDDAARVLGGLRATGTAPGDLVVLQPADDRALLGAFWACVLGDFVPVPVSRALDAPAVDAICRRLGGARLLRDPSGLRHPGPARWDADADRRSAPAVLVLTAGSTGTPKAVALTHGQVLDRSHGTARANDLGPHSVTFNWMPLDHVSGLVMFHIRDVVTAATQIHAPRDWVLADPLRWLDVVHRHRVDTTWAANSAFEALTARLADAGRTGERRWDLSCLRYVMNGGAPVRPRTVRRAVAALAAHGMPGDAMRPGWGMSETSSGVVDHRMDLDSVRDSDRHVPVGRPHPGVSVRVVDDSQQVLPLGELGHLQVKGAPVFSGYYGEDELSGRAFTPDGWFRTGDMAFVRDGALTVTGSADDLITQGGRSCQGHEIEAEVDALGFVEAGGTAACVLDNGELAVFCVLRPEGPAPEQAGPRIAELVLDRFGVRVAHVVPMAAADIPRTPTGKPRRAVLRVGFRPPGALTHDRESRTLPCT